MLRQGAAPGAGISSQDSEELPPEIREEPVVLESTMSAPRQLVSVRPGLDEAVVGEARELPMGLEHTVLGQQILVNLKKTATLDAVSEDIRVALRQFRELVSLIAKR